MGSAPGGHRRSSPSTSRQHEGHDLEPTRMEAAKAAARASWSSNPSRSRSAWWRSATARWSCSNRRTSEARRDRRDRPARAAGCDLTRTGHVHLARRHRRPADQRSPADALEEDLALDIGYFGSAAIVLLSDGEHTSARTRSPSLARGRGRSARSTPSASVARGHSGRDRWLLVATALNEAAARPRSPPSPDGSTTRRRTKTTWPRSTTASISSLTVKAEETEVTGPRHRAAWLCCWSAGG